MKVHEGTYRFFSVLDSLLITNQNICPKDTLVELPTSSFSDPLLRRCYSSLPPSQALCGNSVLPSTPCVPAQQNAHTPTGAMISSEFKLVRKKKRRLPVYPWHRYLFTSQDVVVETGVKIFTTPPYWRCISRCLLLKATHTSTQRVTHGPLPNPSGARHPGRVCGTSCCHCQ